MSREMLWAHLHFTVRDLLKKTSPMAYGVPGRYCSDIIKILL